MAENIDGSNLFSSAGHRWVWGERQHARKTFGAVGTDGAVSMRLASGPRPGTVAGILKAAGATRALADAALTVLEEAIETIACEDEAVDWEDDQGHSGTSLLVLSYRRVGPRQYPIGGGGVNWAAWQAYEAALLELDGAP